MDFNKYFGDNKLSVYNQSLQAVNIKKLISFLQENRNITQLSITYCSLDNQAAKALANSEYLKNLTTLDLIWNEIDNEGAEALANSEYLKNLTTLDLRRNNIGNEGAEALANSEYLKNLTEFDLSWNNIAKEGEEALANSQNLKNFKFLNVDLQKIIQEIEICQALSKAIIISAIAALTVGVGCFAAGVALPMLALIGIAVAVAVLTGCITYAILKPNDKLDEPDLEVIDQQVGAGIY